MITRNASIINARINKNDEFYTQLIDIEKELVHYKKHFKNKIVLCNCDDPRISQFFHYFLHNFKDLKLKRLIIICYKNQQMNLFSKNDSEKAIYLEYNGDKNGNHVPDIEEIGIKYLKSDGDFRSQECINILKQADIVVTNPPFSLFRAYLEQLLEYKKKFLIIGNPLAISNKNIFPLIKRNEIWLGVRSTGKTMLFDIPNDCANMLIETNKNGSAYKIVNNIIKGRAQSGWFTNLEHSKRHKNIILCKKYSKSEYDTYNNYNAINITKTKEIPMDYDGMMGVPTSFMNYYNPDQFEIVGLANDQRDSDDAFVQGKPIYLDEKHKKYVGMVLKKDGKYYATYTRIIIKHKKNINGNIKK